MRDVGSQLAEYFEAVTERIDTADVVASVHVRNQIRRPRGRLRPALAVLAGFVGALILVGGARFASWIGEQPAPQDLGPVAAPVAEPASAWSWWALAATGVIVLGVAALAVRRLRVSTKEDVVDTLQRKPSETIDTRVQTLERRGRWLVAALAFVLVVAAIAVGWLLVENRNLSSDPDAAVYPLEAELTAREQHMADVVERYWAAWEANDFDAIMEMYSPTAVHMNMGVQPASNEEGQLRPTLEAWRALDIADMDLVHAWVVGSDVVTLTDNPSVGLMVTRFTFGSGDEPLIELTDW